MVKLFTIPFSVSKISWFIYNSSCAKYILNIVRYSDRPSKMDQPSLYNHGNPFSTSLAIACSLILPRVPTLEIYYFKMSLFLKTAIRQLRVMNKTKTKQLHYSKFTSVRGTTAWVLNALELPCWWAWCTAHLEVPGAANEDTHRKTACGLQGDVDHKNTWTDHMG